MPSRTVARPPETADATAGALVLAPGEVAAGRADAMPRRREGPAKLTGAAKYTDDLVFPGAWYGITIRSTDPHARLVAIEPDPAMDWSNVVLVTAADIPGENIVSLISDDQPVLVPVGGEIQHVAEPVALLAAADRETLRWLKGHVNLVTEPLPPVFDPEASDHVFAHYDIATGDLQAGFADCPHRPRGRVPGRPPGAALHRGPGDDRRARRGRWRDHPRLAAMSVLRPQGAQAGARDHLGAGPGHPGGDGRRIRRQGGVPLRCWRSMPRCWR